MKQLIFCVILLCFSIISVFGQIPADKSVNNLEISYSHKEDTHSGWLYVGEYFIGQVAGIGCAYVYLTNSNDELVVLLLTTAAVYSIACPLGVGLFAKANGVNGSFMKTILANMVFMLVGAFHEIAFLGVVLLSPILSSYVYHHTKPIPSKSINNSNLSFNVSPVGFSLSYNF